MGDKRRIIIIGGSFAGAKAAARARRMNEAIEITILHRNAFDSPHRKGYEAFPKIKNITEEAGAQASLINPKEHLVEYKDRDGNAKTLNYHKLIIASGAKPIMPDLEGADLKGVVPSGGLSEYLADIKGSKALVIGGGQAGVEAAEALVKAGADTALAELKPHILNFLDPEISLLAENRIRSKGVKLFLGNKPVRLIGENGRLTGVQLADGTLAECRLAVYAIGAEPASELAAEAGLDTGPFGGIIVNQFMQTSDFDIYAAGGCVESRNIVSGVNVYAPSAGAALLQGRAAGENAAAGNKFMVTGTAESSVCRFFDLSIGFTGLSQATAEEKSFDTDTIICAGKDFADRSLVFKLIMEKLTDRIIGAQCVGTGDAERQITAIAMAEKGGLDITDLSCGDLPFVSASPSLDICVTAAQMLYNKKWDLVKTISSLQLADDIKNGKASYIIDVRLPEEFSKGSVSKEAVNIPIAEFRNRLNEINVDKKTPIICVSQTGSEACEAVRMLMQNGRRNAKILEGGLEAWPFEIR